MCILATQLPRLGQTRLAHIIGRPRAPSLRQACMCTSLMLDVGGELVLAGARDRSAMTRINSADTWCVVGWWLVVHRCTRVQVHGSSGARLDARGGPAARSLWCCGSSFAGGVRQCVM